MGPNCVRCDEPSYIIARGMCARCYDRTQRDGTIHSYPTVRERLMRTPTVCECAKPLVDELPLWSTAQCRRCGRKITDENLQGLTE